MSRQARVPGKMGHRAEPGWLRALNSFLADWSTRPDVAGAVLFGSRAHGTATERSDIDVHVVLEGSVAWRERGTRRVDGYLIEYFAIPEPLYHLLHARRADRSWLGIPRMLAYGKVPFDRTGAVTRLQRWGRLQLRRGPPRATRGEIETAKYQMWSGLEQLRGLVRRRSPAFWFHYRHVLWRVMNDFAQAIGTETVAAARTWEHFTSPRYRRLHHIDAHPDERFARLAAACIRARGKATAMRLLERLVARAHQGLGGFDVADWSVRSTAE